MTAAGMLETLVSLSLQISLVIGTTHWLVRRSPAEPVADRLWRNCHIAVLVLTALGLGAPHLRLLPHSIITSQAQFANIQRVESAIGTVLLAIWLCGVAISLLAMVKGVLQTLHLLRNATPLSGNFTGKFGELSTGAKPTRVLSSRQAAGPFCWQIHRPAIVLPDFALSLPDDELTMIVRHEAAHLQAAHPLHLFLQRIVETLFWFHPLVWWASYRADCSREFRCDSESIHKRGDAAKYLRSLLHLAEHTVPKSAKVTAGLCFGGRKNLIQQRVRRLAAPAAETPSTNPFARRLFLARFATVCVLAALLWIPIDASATDRSLWSPWPSWSAAALHVLGVPARDYEIDGHRVRRHQHRSAK